MSTNKPKNSSANKELYTLGEAAKLLGCHRNTLRQWDKKEILKAVRIGERGDRRYRKGDLEKLIK